MAAQLARRRHDPAHAERGADLFGVAAAVRAGADHFLQRDDVGVDRAAARAAIALGPRAADRGRGSGECCRWRSRSDVGPTGAHYAMIVREAISMCTR